MTIRRTTRVTTTTTTTREPDFLVSFLSTATAAVLIAGVDTWVSRSASDRRNLAGKLRSHARNCQRTAIDTPSSAGNAFRQATKSYDLALQANRLDASVVSFRAVSELRKMRDLLGRHRHDSFPVPRSDIGSINIS